MSDIVRIPEEDLLDSSIELAKLVGFGSARIKTLSELWQAANEAQAMLAIAAADRKVWHRCTPRLPENEIVAMQKRLRAAVIESVTLFGSSPQGKGPSI